MKDKLIGIFLYGSNVTRTYPHMRKVIELLEKDGYKTIILDDKNIDEEYEYNLRQVGALVEQCNIIISGNTFGYHLAGAMKKRAVMVCGSVDGNIWVEDYEKVTCVQIPCPVGERNKCWWSMPCLKGSSLREKEMTHCPRCLAEIDPKRVVNEVYRHLKEPKRVLVTVLTYNLSYLTKQMIDSIRSFHDYDILVIDNESTDDTVKWCRSQNIKTIVKKQHVNEAWNMGLQATLDGSYDYILLCNNDAILSSSYLDTLVNVAERREAYAVTGQVINRGQGDDISFPDFARNLEVTQHVMVAGDYSALLLSKECIETIGGFKYFAPRYQCDEDHMLRLRLSEHELIKTYATTFFHKHGCAVKEIRDFDERRRTKEWMEGVHNFKQEWGVDIYEDRRLLNHLDEIKERIKNWKSKIYRSIN